MSPLTITRAEWDERCVANLRAKGYHKLPTSERNNAVAVEMARVSDQATGLGYFFRHYAYVQIKGAGKDKGWQRFCPDGGARVSRDTGKTWDWQIGLMDWMLAFDVFLLLKARQLGMTFVDANVALWAAISAPDQNIAVVANKMQTSKRFNRYVREAYKRLPEWMRDQIQMTNDGLTRLEFSNGSAIEPFSGSPGASRSMSATWVFVDEVGEIERLDEVFGDLEACADNGGRVVMFGTSDGEMGGVLQQWCADGEAGEEIGTIGQPMPDGTVFDIPVKFGENEIGFAFLPWHLHADRDQAWLHTKRRRYRGSLAEFEANYPNSVAEAFHAAGRSYFDATALMRQIERERPIFEARDVRGTLLWEDRASLRVKFVPDPYGHVVLHCSMAELEERIAMRRPFVIPADCAGDDATGDYHAAHVIQCGVIPDYDEERRGVVMVPHVQLMTIHGMMDADHYAELLVRAGYMFGLALIAPEVNGVGTAVVKEIRRMRYPALYSRRTQADVKGEKVTKKLGWFSTDTSKHVAHGTCERHLRNDELEVRDMDTLYELLSIRHLGGGRLGAPKPKHDDRSDALTIGAAIIPKARPFQRAGSSGDPDAPEWNTLEAIYRELAEQESTEKLLGSGQHR